MATSIESQGARKYVDFDEYIDFQLQKARSGIKSTDVLTALAGVGTLVLAYLLVFVLFDHWVIAGGFGQTSRIVMLAVLGVLTVAWLVWKVGIPWVRQVNRLYAARMLEKADPTLQNNLLNLVDLRASGRPVPPEILAAIEKRAALGVSRIDLEQAVDKRPLMHASYALCAIVLLFCAYTLFSPKKISNSIWRALFPTAQVAAPTQTEILEVDPGDAEVLARTQLEVTVDLRGEIPEQVTLYYSTGDSRFVDEPLEMRPSEDDLLQPAGGAGETAGPRRYLAMITGENGRGILQDMTYRIVAGDAVTRDYVITVNQPPSATVDEVRLESPKYMEIETRTQPSGHITAWEGTKVTLKATANMPVTSARLEFLNDPEMAGRVYDLPVRITDGTELQAQWPLTISPDGTYPRYYRIQVSNKDGDVDPQPTVYNLTIRPDQPPEVVLIDPTRDLERPANAVVPLMLQARDPDFKLSYLTLRIEKNGEALPVSPHIFDGPPQPAIATTFEWDLKQHDLKAGDELTYWIEARDNKTPDGNRRNTPKLNIRIVEPVDPEEVAEQLEADKQRQRDRLKEARREQNEENTPDAEPQEPGAEQPPQDQPPQGEQGDQAEPMAGEQDQPQQGEEQGGDGQPSGSQQAPGQGQDGQGEQQLDPNGEQDADAIQKFLENLEKEQQQNQQNDGQPGDKPQPKPSEQQDGQQQPQPEGNDPNAADQPENGQPQNGQQPQGEQKNEQPQSDQPQNGMNDSSQEKMGEGQQNNQPTDGGQQGSSSSPSGSGEQQDDQPNAGEQSPSGAGDQPNQPMGEGTPGEEPNAPGEQSQKNGTDPSKPAGEQQQPAGQESMNEPQEGGESGEPMAGQENGPRDGEPQAGKRGQEKNAGSDQQPGEQGERKGSSAETGEKPAGDEQQPSGASENSQRREQGEPKQGEADPNAEPKSSQDDQPQDGMNDQGRPDPKAPEKAGEGEPKDGTTDNRQGTENPREADPAQQTKPGDQTRQEQPDEKRSEPSDAGQEREPAKRDGQPQGSNEVPKGEGQKGQQSEQPDGGEAGSGQQSEQGQSGSNQRGPGDNVNQPGSKGENGAQPTGGEKGDQKGPGSKTGGEGDQQGKPSGGPDGPKQDGADQPSSSNNGGQQGESTEKSPVGQPDGQKPPQDGQPGQSAAGNHPTGGHGDRPGRPGSEPPDGTANATPPSQPEQANEDYGREAANLVLKKLEEQIERGEIDQEWLKETGWTEDQAKSFAERLQRQLNREQPANPQELARQRQFEEMLRTLRKPEAGGTRSGQNVRDEPSMNEIGPRRLPVPPEYRELYYEYTRSRARRTTVPNE